MFFTRNWIPFFEGAWVFLKMEIQFRSRVSSQASKNYVSRWIVALSFLSLCFIQEKATRQSRL
jgi:hypothetical protein